MFLQQTCNCTSTKGILFKKNALLKTIFSYNCFLEHLSDAMTKLVRKLHSLCVVNFILYNTSNWKMRHLNLNFIQVWKSLPFYWVGLLISMLCVLFLHELAKDSTVAKFLHICLVFLVSRDSWNICYYDHNI